MMKSDTEKKEQIESLKRITKRGMNNTNDNNVPEDRSLS